MRKFVAVVLGLLMTFAMTSAAYAAGTENTDYFVYQGEDYYKAQTDNPAADLQPGEQIDITLGDNAAFTDGTYKLTVVSCGNRESIPIKVNGTDIGTITRTGTGFGMDQMTNDVLEAELDLTAGDTLSIAGVPGEIWGWVDFVQLDKVAAEAEVAETEATETEAADIPKTGETSPAYLLILMATCGIGAIAVSKKNKRAFNK